MDTISPIAWHPRATKRQPLDATPAPAFRSITIMLTEFCNLDCWMCDFGMSKGLRESIAWTPERYVEFLRHPFFAPLDSIGFTGGEPFAYAGVKELYGHIQDQFPAAFLSFSTNATLFKPMSETFALTREWKRRRLITSIDGVALHDVQRGKPGAFDTTMANLLKMRQLYPELGIDVKFTITPVNFTELRAAYQHCTERGFNFTVKMLENNPYYTNILSSAARESEFKFSPEQLDQIGEQLDWILADASSSVSRHRLLEMQELRQSLDPSWTRNGQCSAPTESVFLDSRLNLFCCKEYPPVLNLNSATLDELPTMPNYQKVIAFERSNAQACTRCTSQLKRHKPRGLLARWFR